MPAVYKKIILVFLTAFALNPLHNSFAKWVFISDDNIGNQYYYEDTKTVKDLISEEISAWLLISYAETMQAPDGQSILSVIQDVSYSCRIGYESYKQFYIGYYTGPKGSGISLEQINTTNSAWQRVIPDTMSYLIFEFFCHPNLKDPS